MNVKIFFRIKLGQCQILLCGKKTIKKKKYNMARGREMGKERNGMASQLLAGGNMQSVC
jgi:hypothetical protein